MVILIPVLSGYLFFYTFCYHVDIFPGFYLLISVTPKYVKGTWLRYHEPKEKNRKEKKQQNKRQGKQKYRSSDVFPLFELW